MGAYFHTVDDVLNLADPRRPMGSLLMARRAPLTADPAPGRHETTPGTPVRRCIAMLQSGVIMGELLPITTEVNPAKEYGIYSQQLQVEMSVGGTREHESKVVVIECVDHSPNRICLIRRRRCHHGQSFCFPRGLRTSGLSSRWASSRACSATPIPVIPAVRPALGAMSTGAVTGAA